ncbi:MAG: RNA 3'-terminal phosphate cyclase, partial [Planctomycetaceae bacterium]|nr:RNA 3'-terminal phosphate cyclase [Planctomycetaceae bacterium]
DGSQGEGGGQILRSSLALSLVTGKPFCMENIRAGRKKPGLSRQHLTAVHAATEIGAADVTGDGIGSMRLTFRPQKIKPGDFHFSVGTAGSTTLVLQTVLPALMLAEKPSTLRLTGGTHNPFAPPLDFLVKAYLPLLAKIGPQVETKLVRPGFYPAGGGEFHATIVPTKTLKPLQLVKRDKIVRHGVRLLFAHLPFPVVERERREIMQKTDWDESVFEICEMPNSRGPGNLVMIEAESSDVCELFTGFGEVNVPAEKVARDALEQYRRYLAANVPVGVYLADQLMLPLGIAAHLGAGPSEFLTHDLSLHGITHIDIIKRFLNIDMELVRHDNGQCLVRTAR